jgi:hypothetical protein
MASYYNNILLPDIPADVSLTDYPYIWIRKNETTGYYDLACGTQKYYYSSSRIYIDDGTQKWYRIPIDTVIDNSTEWEFYETISGSDFWGIDDARIVCWSLFDIPSDTATSTTIYYAGNQPIKYYVKYLIMAEDIIYTISNDELVQLTETQVTSALFREKGSDNIPTWDIVENLVSPSILSWHNSSESVLSLTANITAIPFPQVIASHKIDLMHSSIKGIDGVSVDCKGNVLFTASFDNKATWMQHNGTDWVNVADELTGMTKLEFEAITAEQWQTKYELSSDMYIRCTLTDATQTVTSVNISFIN